MGRSDVSGDFYDAKQVPVRILQHYEIVVRSIPPRIANGAQSDQSLDLHLLVFGVQVEMQPASFPSRFVRALIEGNVRASAVRIAQYNPAAVRGISRNVVQRLLPERQHFVEFKATDDDRPDFHVVTNSTHGVRTGSR